MAAINYGGLAAGLVREVSGKQIIQFLTEETNVEEMLNLGEESPIAKIGKEIEEEFGWQYFPRKDGTIDFYLPSDFRTDGEKKDISFRINNVSIRGDMFIALSGSALEEKFIKKAKGKLHDLQSARDDYLNGNTEITSQPNISEAEALASDNITSIPDKLKSYSLMTGAQGVYRVLELLNHLSAVDEPWIGKIEVQGESKSSKLSYKPQDKSYITNLLDSFNNPEENGNTLLEDLRILEIASIYSIRAKMLYEKINQLLLIRQNEATK